MRRCLPLFLALALPTAALPAQEPRDGPAPRRAVPFPRVTVADRFFAPRRATNRTVTLRHALRQLEQTGTLPNFDRAAAGATSGHQGFVFQDSDAYKAIEAAAYALAEQRDPALEAELDAVIARIRTAQAPDGYLNTAYQVQQKPRFTNLRDDHELYCLGHLFEAAVAHFQATGKRTLLDVAVRAADLLVRTFGSEPGQRAGYCGHPEVELALVKLAQATADDNYTGLAAWFVRQRGSRFFAREHGEDPARYDGRYWLDHEPVAAMAGIAGHAVRAAYLMAAAVDIGALQGDEALLRATRRVWRNTVEKNTFVTGGIGPSASNEGFTFDYDLPTASAYQESCASIALLLWAHRLNLVTGDPAYADAMETALYNAIPAGVQLDGTRFFYVNPLASRGQHHRREWFGCACCPPNLARTFAALGGYAYATDASGLYVNLLVQGEVDAEVGGQPFALAVTTDYPWAGEVTLRVVKAPAMPAALHVRVPGWCTDAAVQVEGEPAVAATPGYVTMTRQWRRNDTVRLALPMPVRRLQADPRAEALRGRVAFARGPLVYCLEQVDQTAPVDELCAPPGVQLRAEPRPDLLGGVTVLTGELPHAPPATWTGRGLYRATPAGLPVTATLVPYAVWDNRAAGPMAVWLPQAPPPPRLAGPEATAAIALSYQHANCDPEGLRDGEEPDRSDAMPPRNCHFGDHLGGTEWAEYRWREPQTLNGCRIYWFDDSGRGQCRLPKAARLLYRDGDQWRPVPLAGAGRVPLQKDVWCEVAFAPLTTTALRLELDQQDGFASGILEWRVLAAEDER